jgi:hypothetical protein
MCEMPSVYSESTPTARKEHKCCECGGTIQIGEKYHYCHGIWDGRASTYKVCVDCDSLRKSLDAEAHWDEVTAFGQLCESADGSDRRAEFALIVQKRKRTLPNWLARELPYVFPATQPEDSSR